ncbi:MAG: hypothetical protein H7242_01895 [Microbacteriaceae bacterium]|nr:hypothetical protein [Burkholderiaceae bacterium]
MKALTLAMASSLALAGCFGGGGDGEVAPMPADPLAMVPDSALLTAAGTVDYQKLLNSMPSETREAIDVSAVVLPTSETAEPVAVD